MPDFRLGRLRGEFVVVWEEGGKRRRYRLGTRDPKEARATLREFISRRDARLGQPDRQGLAEIWTDYVAEKRAEGKSVSRQLDAWKRLAPVFGGMDTGELSAGDVRAYTASRRAQGASDGTIHTELGYLRAALRKALKQNAPDVALPSKPRPRTRYLTPQEARRLLDHAQMPHVRLFLLLGLHSAGRPSAILELRWDRVDFDKGSISLDNPARDRTAKGRATVPLGAELVAPLKAAKAAALTEYVIEWNGKPVASIKKAIQRTAERAGLEGVTPYVLRHTAARWLVEGGVPIEEVAQYLGHTSPAITFKVYGRYSPDYLQKASSAISDRLNKVQED